MIFPPDLSPYRLVVHCGACMWNRREMLSRILRCQQAGVPDHQLRLGHRLQPGHLRAGVGAFPGGAGALDAPREARSPLPAATSQPG